MISRLLRISGVMVVVLCAMSAPVHGERQGDRITGVREASHEPGPRLPIGQPKAVAQPRSSAKQLYAVTENGLFASKDEGRHWDRLHIASLKHDDVLTMAVHPTHEERLFISTRDGLRKSLDGGISWRPLASPTGARSAVRSIALSPSVPETIYVGTEQEGIFRSPDGGNSWSPAGHGLPEALAGKHVVPIGSLAVDATNPQIAYAGTELHGLYKTTDGGASWVVINRGLGLFPLPWRVGSPSLLVDRADTRRLMVMFLRPLRSRLVRTFIHQSPDGGEHWLALEVELPSDAQGIALIEDPSDPKRVVLLTTTGSLRIPWQPVVGVETAGQQP